MLNFEILKSLFVNLVLKLTLLFAIIHNSFFVEDEYTIGETYAFKNVE